MKYGNITVGQIARCLGAEYTQDSEGETVEETLSSIAERAVETGLLTLLENSTIIENVPMDNGTSVVRVSDNDENYSLYACNPGEAQRIIYDLSRTCMGLRWCADCGRSSEGTCTRCGSTELVDEDEAKASH